MAYPANFMETFGIVFVQAMAAGVIPVIPNLGNLPNLVDPSTGIIVRGAPDSMEYGPRFVDAVARATEAPAIARESASDSVRHYDWPTIAAQWNEILTPTIKVLSA
jgi:glycosyltransferase involved in cell wall biosynthesis